MKKDTFERLALLLFLAGILALYVLGNGCISPEKRKEREDREASFTCRSVPC